MDTSASHEVQPNIIHNYKGINEGHKKLVERPKGGSHGTNTRFTNIFCHFVASPPFLALPYREQHFQRIDQIFIFFHKKFLLDQYFSVNLLEASLF